MVTRHHEPHSAIRSHRHIFQCTTRYRTESWFSLWNATQLFLLFPQYIYGTLTCMLWNKLKLQDNMWPPLENIVLFKFKGSLNTIVFVQVTSNPFRVVSLFLPSIVCTSGTVVWWWSTMSTPSAVKILHAERRCQVKRVLVRIRQPSPHSPAHHGAKNKSIFGECTLQLLYCRPSNFLTEWNYCGRGACK